VIAAALIVYGTWALAGASQDGDSEAALADIARERDAIWQVNTTVSGRMYSIDQASPSPSTDGMAEGLDLTLIKFVTPLHDDGAPYSLEPFLQRRSRLSFSLDGGHFSTRNPLGSVDRTNWSGGIGGAQDTYVQRWLALTSGEGYHYDALHDVGVHQSSHAFAGSLGLGVRAADTRVDVSYGLLVVDVAGSVKARQSLSLSAFTVIARCFSASLSGTVIPSGAEGDISLEYFPTRALGVFAGAFAGRGQLHSDDLLFRRYAGRAGLAAWIDHAFGILGEYALTIENLPTQGFDQSVPGYREVSHTVTLEIYWRFPRF